MDESKEYPKYYYNRVDNKVLARKSDLRCVIYQVYETAIEQKCLDDTIKFQNKQELDNLIKMYEPCTQAHYLKLVNQWFLKQEAKVKEMVPHFKK